MTSRPDPLSIPPPPELPPDIPDAQTEAEQKEITKARERSPTPTERAERVYGEHITALQLRIDFHCDQVKELQGELKGLREAYAAEMNAAHEQHKEEAISTLRRHDEDQNTIVDLRLRCQQLEVSGAFSSGLVFLGNASAAVGATLLAIAGAAPIGDGWKIGLVAGGSALSAIGLLLSTTMQIIASNYKRNAPPPTGSA